MTYCYVIMICYIYVYIFITYIFIYFLTAVWLAPGGSSTVHIYTQYIEYREQCMNREQNVHKQRTEYP
jgi:hypothetical protein